METAAERYTLCTSEQLGLDEDKMPAQQLHSSSYPSRKSLKEEARSPGLAGPVAGLCSLRTSQNAVAGEETELEWLFYFRGGHPRL